MKVNAWMRFTLIALFKKKKRRGFKSDWRVGFGYLTTNIERGEIKNIMARKRLVEDFVKDWARKTLPLKRLRLKENIIFEGDKKASTGYEVPIWVLNKKNLNGRTYSTRLAEKVVRDSPKTYVLKDHPEDDGSVDRIVAIAENPHIREGILYCNAYLVDSAFEKKLERILERGLGLGVSSSAYGDVDDTGNVLLEEFEIDRLFDFVISPSFTVYLTKEGQITESENINIEEENIMDKSLMEERDIAIAERNGMCTAQEYATLYQEQVSTEQALRAALDTIEYLKDELEILGGGESEEELEKKEDNENDKKDSNSNDKKKNESVRGLR